MPIPVNVFTGFLGAGKTTVITELIKQLPVDYKMVWLKNEYGDINVDKVLASESNVQTAEIMNGCLCCVLVGRLGNAVTEIVEKYQQQRIFIESSGTAYPLPIVLELNKIPQVELDSVITVVDTLNFTGYKDPSQVAAMQAQATDIILLNKHELATAQQLDNVLELVGEFNPHTPKLKTHAGKVAADLILNLDPSRALHSKLTSITSTMHNEHGHDHPDDVEVFEYQVSKSMDIDKLESLLQNKLEQGYIRIKGIVNTTAGPQVLNWVLGRLSWQLAVNYSGPTQLVFMGQDVQARFAKLQIELDQIIK
jgi:G3E family GTPase